MSRSKRRKHNKGPAVLLILLVLLVIGAIIFISSMKNYNKAYKPESTDYVEVTVPSGSGTDSIGRILENNGIIKDYFVFKLKSRLNKLDGTYQAGTYNLSPSMTMDEIITALHNAKRESVRCTIVEGLNLKEIGFSLEKQGLVSSAQDFFDALSDDYDYWFIGKGSDNPDPSGTLNKKQNRLEGLLFPETYEFFKNATPHEIIDKMLAQTAKILGDDMQKTLKDKGLNINEVMTIASLIEKECADDGERNLVSSVIYNRLEKGMRLEFCSTIQYILGYAKDGLTTKDTQIESIYNSYLYPGLPPGPIACPGKASIEAALNPADTNYLYFVVKEYGKTKQAFSETYEEFLKNKAAYKNSIK